MKKADLISRRIPEVLDRETFKTTIKGKLDECFQGKIVQYEMRYEYPLLGETDLFVSYFPMRGPKGIDRVTIVLKDVTERKRAEAALRMSEQRYRLLFEKNVAGVLIASMDGEVLDCNDGWAHILGYDSADEIRGWRTTEFYFKLADWEPLLGELKREGGFSSREMQFRRKDGAPVWGVVTPVVVAGGQDGESLIQATAIDITERKMAEEALRKSEERYRRFVAQSLEGIFREELDAPVAIDLPEDELAHHILHDAYLAECNDAMT